MSIIIATTFLFIFVVIVFVLLKRRRLKNQEWNSAEEERVGEEGHQMILLLQQSQQQPDLIRNEGPEKCQLISRLNDCNTNLLDHFVVRCDPLPSVPHTLSSANSDLVSQNANQIACSQSSFNHSNHGSMVGTPRLKPTSAVSMATITTTATISTSEDDNNYSEPEYAEPIMVNRSRSPSPPPPPISRSFGPQCQCVCPRHSPSIAANRRPPFQSTKDS